MNHAITNTFSCLRIQRLVVATTFARLPIRNYQSSSVFLGQQVPPRPTIDEDELEESFLKGSGPGGQKINKTASAVQLKHVPSGLVVKSQATRSRSQNRKIARRILAEKIEVMEKGKESRIMIRTELKRRKKASMGKKSRRKYRALDEAKSNDSYQGNDFTIGADPGAVDPHALDEPPEDKAQL